MTPTNNLRFVERLEIIDEQHPTHTVTWEVWSEGYRATGESAGAKLEGKVEAETWPEACRKACVDSGRWKEQPGGFDAKRLTVWGCRLFDNEADARRSFG
jgi:hypothetical protein